MPCVILVIDDESLLLDTLCEMLEDLGHEAICVDCPFKGIDQIEQDPRIAMVLTDVQMPAMSGFELAELLRSKRPNLPVVLMSGAHPGRPGYPVVRKPLTQRQLEEIVAPVAG